MVISPDYNKIVQQFNKNLHPVSRHIGLKLCYKINYSTKTCQRMKQKLLLIVLFACMSGMAAFAQSVRVSGRVTTSGSAPLPGTNIAVKGTSRGVISDDDGRFSIDVPARATLIISHIGFSTKLVPVKGQTSIMVSLDSSSREMDNVVVIGYQTASRKSVSTSISSVSAKDIESYTTGNVANTLQGKVP